MFQSRLPRPILDHFPIFPKTKKWERAKTPFTFENMWQEFEGLYNLINDWWGEAHIASFASYVVARTLTFVKEKLKKRNQEDFNDIKAQKCNVIGIINSFDAKEDSCGHTSGEIQHRNDLMEIFPTLHQG